jgi:hypothetical protein
MRRARNAALTRSIPSAAFAIILCATAALALPPRAEAAIHLGDPNTVSFSNGLVGYWPLDGQVTDWATGRTKDISGNGNDGSLALMSTSSSPVGGKIGQAMTFNGSSNYLPAGNGSLLSTWRLKLFYRI